MFKADPKANQSIRLRDGRRLGFAEYGVPDGKPVFLFHGLFGSRLQHHPDHTIAEELGVRIVATDRPGFGLSDLSPCRTLLAWPDDIVQLADALAIDRFAILGVSGGAPYAAACALRIPRRLSNVAFVSGIGPLHVMRANRDTALRHRLLFMATKYAPWLLPLPLKLVRHTLRRHPRRLLGKIAATLSASDQTILARPEIQSMLAEDAGEAYRQGIAGARREIAVLSEDWKFALQDIAVEVQLWHGESDQVVPARVGRYTAQALPRCRARFIAGAGHFLIFDYWREILACLTQ